MADLGAERDGGYAVDSKSNGPNEIGDEPYGNRRAGLGGRCYRFVTST
jgi:hypothetical protein